MIEAFKYAEYASPAWAEAVKRQISSESVFDKASSEGPVQLLEYLANQGDLNSRMLLEEGGRGSLGGTGPQILRAATIAILVQEPGIPTLDYVDSILSSPLAPSGESIGCQIAHFLVRPRSWPNNDCLPALECLERTLEDERFSKEAAVMTLQLASSIRLPEAVRSYWEHILQKASDISER